MAVPRPIIGAANILAEKSFLCFFESDISGDTIDANICPNTGMCSSGVGMGWVKGQETGLVLVPHGLRVTATSFCHLFSTILGIPVSNGNITLTSPPGFCNDKEKARSSRNPIIVVPKTIEESYGGVKLPSYKVRFLFIFHF